MKYLIALILFSVAATAQVEHVPVANPVYAFLVRAESKGYLPNRSLSSLPLQRKEITSMLMMIKRHEAELSGADRSTLENFEKEFGILPNGNSTLFGHDQGNSPLLFDGLFGGDEKYIYRSADTLHNFQFKPLLRLDGRYEKYESGSDNVALGFAGFRIYGTLSGNVGYFLQATNGAVLSGNKAIAAKDPILSQNIKFTQLNSDIDFTESHVRYDNQWFYAAIGRETRLLGSGLDQRLFLSNASPAFDAFMVGARFTGFEYRFTHGSLLALPEDSPVNSGFSANIPAKYVAIHRFSFRPSWGELSFWEQIIYSKRAMELAYLNPLSFYKSLEHSLHDRDNSLMGFDGVIRPFDGLQLKGTFVLDDIIFGEIGKNFWSNKTAWNIAALYSFDFPLDAGIEYCRVEPYMFSHFNVQNSVTNDSRLLSGNMLPNSDQLALALNYWWGERYPLSLKISRTRHGDNIYDMQGKMTRNVGGDPLFVYLSGTDSMRVVFLDGNLKEDVTVQLSAGFEPVRNFNIRAWYALSNINGAAMHSAIVKLSVEDF